MDTGEGASLSPTGEVIHSRHGIIRNTQSVWAVDFFYNFPSALGRSFAIRLLSFVSTKCFYCDVDSRMLSHASIKCFVCILLARVCLCMRASVSNEKSEING